MLSQTKTFQEQTKETEIQIINDAIKDNKNLRLHIRYMVIYNYLQGYLNIEIAKMNNLSQHTVGTYIRKYKSGGLNALIMGKSPGAPRHLTSEQEDELKEIILTKTPDQMDFDNKKNWNTTIIIELVSRLYGVKYCQRGMLEVLYRLNLSFTRPTYTLEKANPQKQEKFKQEFELLKKSN